MAKKQRNSQASMENMVVYGIEILIIILAIVFLYSYGFNFVKGSLKNSCQLSSGAECTDMLITRNSLTSNTQLVLFLANSQSTAIIDPYVIARVGSTNSTSYNCIPSYVKPGGAMICQINLTSKTTNNQYLNGSIYLEDKDCGISTQESSCAQLQTIPQETYIGQFDGYAASSPNPKITITLTAQTYNELINVTDHINATATLLGTPIKGATINFTTSALLSSALVGYQYNNTDAQGEATDYVIGRKVGSVKFYANLSNAISGNAIINFYIPSTGITTTIPYQLCTSSGTVHNITVTDANYSQHDPISYSGSDGRYNIIKITEKPLYINTNGAGFTDCLSINATVGGGNIIVTENGAGGGETIYVKNNGNVTLDASGADVKSTIYLDGNGNLNITGPGAGNNYTAVAGAGNINMSFSLAGSAINLTHGDGNVIMKLNGAGNSNVRLFNYNHTSTVNVIQQAAGDAVNITNGNVIISNNGAGNTFNIFNATPVFISNTGSSNIFNTLNGTDTISTQGSGNIFNLANDIVTSINCHTSSGGSINPKGTTDIDANVVTPSESACHVT